MSMVMALLPSVAECARKAAACSLDISWPRFVYSNESEPFAELRRRPVAGSPLTWRPCRMFSLIHTRGASPFCTAASAAMAMDHHDVDLVRLCLALSILQPRAVSTAMAREIARRMSGSG